MMRRVRLAAIVMILGLLFVGNVWAHAFLTAAVPAVGSSVSTGPKELRLHFSETVELKFSSVKITLEGGKEIASVRLAADPSDPQLIVVNLPTPLARGVYLIKWRVVSVDTHKTQGDYRFTVKQ
jgi:copper resistance protein C